jgi:hypothetical protein
MTSNDASYENPISNTGAIAARGARRTLTRPFPSLKLEPRATNRSSPSSRRLPAESPSPRIATVRSDSLAANSSNGSSKQLVSFALGERAVTAARAKKLAAAVLDVIDASPRYAEGRGVRFEVKSVRQIPSLVVLTQIKNEH